MLLVRNGTLITHALLIPRLLRRGDELLLLQPRRQLLLPARDPAPHCRRARHGRANGRAIRHGARHARQLAQHADPLLRVALRVGAESEFVRAGELAADAPFACVFAADVEGVAVVDGTDGAVGEVEGHFGGGVLCEEVVALELVQVFRGGDDVVRGVVLFEQAGFALQAALDEGLRRGVGLVGEADGVEAAVGRVGVDKDVVVAAHEVVPLA